MGKLNFKLFNVFVEVIYTVYFPIRYFVINEMCIMNTDQWRSIENQFRFGKHSQDFFKPSLAYLSTTVILQTQLIDKKIIL